MESMESEDHHDQEGCQKNTDTIVHGIQFGNGGEHSSDDSVNLVFD